MSRRDEKNESNRIRKRFLFRYEHALPFDKSVAKQVQVVEAESIVCRQDMSGVGLSRVAYKRIEVVWICALGDEVVVEVPAERCGGCLCDPRAKVGGKAGQGERSAGLNMASQPGGACSTEDIVKREQGFPPSEIGLVWVPGIGQNR